MSLGMIFFVVAAILFALMGLDVIDETGLSDIVEWTFCCLSAGHVFGGFAFAIPAGWVKTS